MMKTIAQIELEALHEPRQMHCPCCKVAVFIVRSDALVQATAPHDNFYFYSGRDVCQELHNSVWDRMIVNGHPYPYTLHADGLSGSCQSCGEALFGISFGFVDAAVSELFDDRYFDNNLPTIPKPTVYLGKLLNRPDVEAPFPWWIVRKYKTDIGDVFHHTLGVWSENDFESYAIAGGHHGSGLNRSDFSVEMVKAIIPELCALSVDARLHSMHKRVCEWTKKTSRLIE